jgi:hypothetical protein
MPVDPKTLYDEEKAIEIDLAVQRLVNSWGKRDTDGYDTATWNRISVNKNKTERVVYVASNLVFERTSDGETKVFRPGKWVALLVNGTMHEALSNAETEAKRQKAEYEERAIRANFEPFDDSGFFKD